MEFFKCASRISHSTSCVLASLTVYFHITYELCVTYKIIYYRHLFNEEISSRFVVYLSKH